MVFWESLGNALIANWADLMINALWQGSLAILLVWSFTRLFPGIHPTIRCWLWRLAFLKLFVAFLWVKPIELYLQYNFKELLDLWIKQVKLHHYSHLAMIGQSSLGLDQFTRILRSGTTILFLIWLIGLTWFIARLILIWRKKQLVDKFNRPIDNPSLVLTYQNLGTYTGLKKIPQLLTSELVHTPLLEGPINPKIIIPTSMLATYQEKEIELILAHELAHYQRNDLFWNWLPTITRIIFFFNPLVWLTHNEWTRVQEICCDYKALQLTQAPQSDYGRVLLRASFSFSINPTSPAVTFYSSTNKQTLKKRLRALRDTNPLKFKSIIVSGFILLMLGIALVVPWQLAEAKSLPVNLWINYLTLTRNFEIAAHVILPEKDIVKLDLLIDDQKLNTYHASKSICYGYAKPNENCFPKKGPHKVTLKVLTKTGLFEEQNWIYFQDRLNWSNRYLCDKNAKTVLKIGPFICVVNN